MLSLAIARNTIGKYKIIFSFFCILVVGFTTTYAISAYRH